MPGKPIIVDKSIQRLALLILIILGLSALFYTWAIPLFTLANTPPSEEYQVYKAALTEIPVDDISMLEGNADFKFPPSAHEIYGYVTGFREVDTFVRFSMKASELPAFIKTTLCDKPLENFEPTAEQKEQKDFLGWWKAYQAKTLQRCLGKSESANQAVFVDMTDPETYIVYIGDSTPITVRSLPTQPKTETNP